MAIFGVSIDKHMSVVILMSIGIASWVGFAPVTAFSCSIKWEPNPKERGIIRWVTPLNHPLQCQCTSIYQTIFKRYDCDDCSMTCETGGKFIDSPCPCSCDKNWIGKNCDECALTDCKNGGTLDEQNCSCTCPEGWMGNTCADGSALLFNDCSEALKRGVTESGVYTIKPLDSDRPFKVYCDMETDGGGWTVFQRRKDGSVDFYLDFANYSQGFGDLEGEFWLGNDNLHRMTAQGEYELRVDLSDFENESRYAVYASFSIADVSDNYTLALGNYSGTAGDSLSYHNDHQFSTRDRDNDAASDSNCAQQLRGAWWFNDCHDSDLNGEYLLGNTTGDGPGVVWFDWTLFDYSLKTSEMKIRATP